MKRKTNDVPTEQVENVQPAFIDVKVTVPLGAIDDDVGPTHLDIRLPPKAARALLSIRDGLRHQTARFDDGRPVWTGADTLRYLLEAIGENGAVAAKAS